MTHSVNVVIAIPDNSVESMRDEIADGTVASFVEAARKSVVAKLDTDGDIPVAKYSGDLDDALAQLVAQYGDGTVFVVGTDYVSDDHSRAIRITRENPNKFFLLTELSNQGVDGDFKDALDADSEGDNNVDTVNVADLADATVALKELNPHLKRLATASA